MTATVEPAGVSEERSIAIKVAIGALRAIADQREHEQGENSISDNERRAQALLTHLSADHDALRQQLAEMRGAVQRRVHAWMLECFGAEIAADKTERSHRFIEEALELVQATGITRDEVVMLVDYTFGRPVGELQQEVGGVMVTLAALCTAHSIDMNECAETEVARVWGKIDQIRRKQAGKPRGSPLPAALAPTSQPSRGKCERCNGAKRIEQMPAPKAMKDKSSSPSASYWIDCPDCAQPERQVLVIDDAPYNLLRSPPQDDIVAGLREMHEFLRGAGTLHGCSFGEKPVGARGNFWWREPLGAVIDRAIAALGEKGCDHSGGSITYDEKSGDQICSKCKQPARTRHD